MKKLMTLCLCVLATSTIYSAEVSQASQSVHYIDLWDQLVSLQTEAPDLAKIASEKNSIFRVEASEALGAGSLSGFSLRYQIIWKGEKDQVLPLLDASQLRWFAFCQNKYGKGNPFSYDATKKLPLAHPVYPESEEVVVHKNSSKIFTTYSLVRALLGEIDNIEGKSPLNMAEGDRVKKRLGQLENNLKKAIQDAQQDVDKLKRDSQAEYQRVNALLHPPHRKGNPEYLKALKELNDKFTK